MKIKRLGNTGHSFWTIPVINAFIALGELAIASTLTLLGKGDFTQGVLMTLSFWVFQFIIISAKQLQKSYEREKEDEMVHSEDMTIANIKIYLHKVITESLNNQDLFWSHFSRRLLQLRDDLRDAATSNRVSISADHFLTVDNVMSAFSGSSTPETVWRVAWVIRKNDLDEPLLTPDIWFAFFREAMINVREGLISKAKFLILLESDDLPSMIKDQRLKNLLSFFSDKCCHDKFECKYVDWSIFKSLCKQSNIDTAYLDFGIYADKLIYRTYTETEQMSKGEYSRDAEFIKLYIKAFDYSFSNEGETSGAGQACVDPKRPTIDDFKALKVADKG